MKNRQNNTTYLARLQQEEPFLRRLARVLLRDEHAAEDLVQETMLSAVRTFSSSGQRAAVPQSLRSWLGTALRRKSVDEMRRQGRSCIELQGSLGAPGKDGSVADAAPPDEIVTRLEQQRLLHGALARLSPDEQAAIVLRFQEELSIAQISARTGAPVPTIKSRLERGLQKVRADLERKDDWRAALGVLLLPPGSAAHRSTAAFTSATTSLWMNTTVKTTLAVVVAFSLVLGAVWVTGGGEDEVQEFARAMTSKGSVSAVTPGLQAAGSSGERGRREELHSAELLGDSTETAVLAALPTAIHGLVISRTSRAPILAQVRWGGRAASAASRTSGAFYLDSLDADEAHPVLSVTHPDFEPLSLSLADLPKARGADGGLDVGYLQMEPVGRVAVTVADKNGEPLEGARCHLHRSLYVEGGGIAPAPGELDTPLFAGVTDASGKIELPLAKPAALWVEAADGRCALAKVGPLQPNTIRIAGEARTAVFLGSIDQKPVIHRAFPLGWDQGQDRASIYVWTDQQGRVDLPVGAGRLSISKSMPRLLFDGCRVRSDRGWRALQDVDDGSFQTIVTLDSTESELALDVARNERTIRLTDAVTGVPIEGEAYCQWQYLHDGEWSGPGASQPYEVLRGQMVVHKWFTDASSNRRFVAVPGYEILFIEGARDLAGAELFLRPAEARSLRFTNAIGEPISTNGALKLGGGIGIRFRTGRDGIAGPFPWAPGESWGLYTANQEAREFSAEELSAQETLEVQAAIEPCELRVLDVPPDAPPLLAQSTEVSVAGVRDGVTVLFKGLPPGLYCVGPEAWVDQMRSRVQVTIGWDRSPEDPTEGTDRALQVPLAPGETRDTPWKAEWRSESVVTGHVECDALTGQSLFAYPLYGTTGTHINVGTDAHWLACDSDGTFRTRQGDPVPVAFLFGVMESGTRGRTVPVVLDSQRVRQDGEYVIGLTSVEVLASNANEWKAAAVGESQRPQIYAVRDSRALDAPMDISQGPGPTRWNPAEPLRLEGLPSNTSSLRIAIPGSRDRVEGKVQPGGHTQLVIEIPLSDRKQPASAPVLIQTR